MSDTRAAGGEEQEHSNIDAMLTGETSEKEHPNPQLKVGEPACPVRTKLERDKHKIGRGVKSELLHRAPDSP